MKNTVKRARVTRLARAAALLPRNFLILKFTPAQLYRLEKAARICGWRAGEGGACARQLALGVVKEILHS
jgi:hypothetical protein